MRIRPKGFINIALRALTIALKFLLSIILIKSLSLEEYGQFGLIQSTVLILVFIIGFDFYTYSSREILKNDSKELGYYITNQLLFHLIGYFIVLPLLIIIVHFNVFSSDYLFYAFAIVIAEHLSQEIYRLLILIEKTVIATIVLFVRSGLWIIFLLIILNVDVIRLTMSHVLLFWAVGAFLSIIVGIKKLKFKFKGTIDYNWLKKGAKIAAPFFAATIMYKTIEFSGRYFLDMFRTKEQVGIYTFYSGVANILFVFVQTIVIIELYPKLIESLNTGYKTFVLALNNFNREITKFTILGLALSLIFIYPLVWYLNEPELIENLLSYIILLFSTVCFCLSFVSHYALYALQKDIKILYATAISFLMNLVLSIILIPNFGLIGASIAQFSSYLLLLIVKFMYWKRISKTMDC